ncbi:helix-turn-helix domain-containing protein [Microlunatus sagamiharensis]|uniref:helix-turn-helix domain-containing protein n=1 Tax=Microlunatus sagamiharensis TaxID=546874 RepID=UPI0022B260D5|nr:helix-turn-helix transcriptional regulator [Microlunatus sagamiharensis]
MRQLADLTGISNPYLSQIERGLRRPSAEVLQQLSKALRVSAESLYVRAGILDPRTTPPATSRRRCWPTRRSPSGTSRCCSTSTAASWPRTRRPSPAG